MWIAGPAALSWWTLDTQNSSVANRVFAIRAMVASTAGRRKALACTGLMADGSCPVDASLDAQEWLAVTYSVERVLPLINYILAMVNTIGICFDVLDDSKVPR